MGIIQKSGGTCQFFFSCDNVYLKKHAVAAEAVSPAECRTISNLYHRQDFGDPGRVVKPFVWASSFQFAHAPDGFN